MRCLFLGDFSEFSLSPNKGDRAVSLSTGERRELERLRKYYGQSMARKEANDNWAWALSKGIGLAIISYGAIQYFTPDTLFGRSVNIFGALVCFAVGILSSYYGPFKKKEG